MIINHPFLTWFIACALILTGFFWAWHSGFVLDVWHSDQTYITSIIMTLFVVIYVKLGFIARGVDRVNVSDNFAVRNLRRQLKLGMFYGVYCFTLGIIGTVIGFILMLKSGELAGDVSNPAVQSTLLPSVIAHLSTALYCTAAGIIAGAVIQKTTFFLLYALEAKEDA